MTSKKFLSCSVSSVPLWFNLSEGAEAMIWFTCKNAARNTAGRTTSSGTLVFCECGQGNTVPWQSTTSPPEAPPEPPPAAPAEAATVRRPRPAAIAAPVRRPREGDLLRRRKAKVFRRRRPGFCLNHDDIATDKTCAECKESFCPNCVVELQGKDVVRAVQELPCPRPAPARLVSPAGRRGLVVGLVSGPVTFCLTMFGSRAAGGGAGPVVV